ncbi:MAG: amino acid permease [Clostridiaceae bacterium]
MKNIFRTKSINDLLTETSGDKSLKKVLGSFELTMLGIGAIIGTGIFVLTGIAAANYSGPALIISFIIAGLACAFAALCYAEFASMVPVAGSAYTYGYTALGEIWAWIIGWDLILEYAFCIATVAIGLSGYLVNLLASIGIVLPKALTSAAGTGGVVNLPAILVIACITGLLVLGVKESTKFNNIIVGVKVIVVLLFIALGVGHVNTENWSPFMPYGWSGVFTGASVIFFAYIGFDAVSTAAEEVKNPQKDLPRGIIGSLIICTILYIVVSGILTGMVPYLDFKETSAPVAFALEKIGIHWGSALVSIGALCGLTSVLMVMMFGQTRVLFAMSRDGLLPKAFGDVHPKFKTPVKSTVLVGVVTAILAGFTPIGVVAELTNIGTLAAFIIVSAAVIVLRVKEPNRKRAFKCPLVPVVPALSIIACSVLIYMLPAVTQVRFVIWLALGVVVYFAYSYKNSTLNEPESESAVVE